MQVQFFLIVMTSIYKQILFINFFQSRYIYNLHDELNESRRSSLYLLPRFYKMSLWNLKWWTSRKAFHKFLTQKNWRLEIIAYYSSRWILLLAVIGAKLICPYPWPPGQQKSLTCDSFTCNDLRSEISNPHRGTNQWMG